mmetsp:Transcript_58551/g.188145  ORF Transcript_58551/g.188145 Transcript_58551/m.188145 type:complete len:531 (-) Transcript_58551:168-1760(-)
MPDVADREDPEEQRRAAVAAVLHEEQLPVLSAQDPEKHRFQRQLLLIDQRRTNARRGPWQGSRRSALISRLPAEALQRVQHCLNRCACIEADTIRVRAGRRAAVRVPPGRLHGQVQEVQQVPAAQQPHDAAAAAILDHRHAAVVRPGEEREELTQRLGPAEHPGELLDRGHTPLGPAVLRSAGAIEDALCRGAPVGSVLAANREACERQELTPAQPAKHVRKAIGQSEMRDNGATDWADDRQGIKLWVGKQELHSLQDGGLGVVREEDRPRGSKRHAVHQHRPGGAWSLLHDKPRSGLHRIRRWRARLLMPRGLQAMGTPLGQGPVQHVACACDGVVVPGSCCDCSRLVGTHRVGPALRGAVCGGLRGSLSGGFVACVRQEVGQLANSDRHAHWHLLKVLHWEVHTPAIVGRGPPSHGWCLLIYPVLGACKRRRVARAVQPAAIELADLRQDVARERRRDDAAAQHRWAFFCRRPLSSHLGPGATSLMAVLLGTLMRVGRALELRSEVLLAEHRSKDGVHRELSVHSQHA